jgi:predicted phage terminase large subunit-like protein
VYVCKQGESGSDQGMSRKAKKSEAPAKLEDAAPIDDALAEATLIAMRTEFALRRERKKQSREGGLIEFVRYFWQVVEPETKLVEGWVLYAICDHLEAVSFGKITRLLINVPPGSMKSLMVNVFWPAFEWGALGMASTRYVSFSYSSGLTERDNLKFKKLIVSERYQEMWGDKFKIEKEGEIKITNNKTGSKFASSVKGIGTGERGDRVVIDDPHDVHRSESEIVRTDTVRWFRETITDRLNSLTDSAIIIIMQRVHQLDISGFILEQGWQYCHLMVPMEYEAGREPYNTIGWVDPRTEDGDLAWPERFPPEAVARIEIEKGSFAYAGQYQQRPAPRGGGIIKREHWRPYTPDDCGKFGVPWPKFPVMSYTVLSLDTAQTEKKQNDPSAGVVLGVCRDIWENRRIITMWGWAERLELYELVKKVEETCKKFKVDRVLIEDKASGYPVAQELRRRARTIADSLSHNPKTADRADFGVTLIPPEGDKLARGYAVQNLFECGLIYAPAEPTGNGDFLFKDWAEKIIDECATAPKGQFDDRFDAMTQALLHLRNIGLITLPDEDEIDRIEESRYQREPQPLYPAYGGSAYPLPTVTTGSWSR